MRYESIKISGKPWSILSTKKNKFPSAFVLVLFSLVSFPALAQMNYRESSRFSPSDYLMGSHGTSADAIFDSPSASIDLSLDLGITSDCGKINIQNTLQSALKNTISDKYFDKLGTTMINSAPMLVTCFASPTWCHLMENFRLQSNLLLKFQADQCAFVSKVIDKRKEDYELERQRCVNDKLSSNGGNIEAAMDDCGSKSDTLKSWAGGADTKSNKLIASTAEWAQLTDPESQKTVSLVQSLVGDSVIGEGKIRVDFGPSAKQTTPRIYLITLEKDLNLKLCTTLVSKAIADNNVDFSITAADLRSVSGESDEPLIDRQTIRLLSFMPERKRRLICRKLSDAMALTVFSNDMSKSLDFLSSKVALNPNIPESRKTEAERKRLALRDQIDSTLALYKNRSEPLNDVLYQVNNEGERYASEITSRGFATERAERATERIKANLLDCADGVLCQQ